MHVSPSGKRYIGITKQRLERRWRGGDGYSRNSHFYRAVQKYGWENFEHAILAENLTESDAKELEIALIAKGNLTDGRYGYNVSKGGDTGSGLNGENHPNYGKHLSESTRKKIAQKAVGRQSPMFGRHHSEATRERWSVIRRGRKNQNTSRKVTCIETGVVYASIKEAAMDTGANATNISKVCRGIYTSTGGLRWSYSEEVIR